MLFSRPAPDPSTTSASHQAFSVGPAPANALETEPPDPRLVDRFGADQCIRHRVLPWKKISGVCVVLCTDPISAETVLGRLQAAFGPVRFALLDEAAILQAITATRQRTLVQVAESRVIEQQSCRTIRKGPIALVAAGVGLGLVGLVAPRTLFALLCLWAVLTLVVNSGLRVMAAAVWLWQRAGHNRATQTSQGPTLLPVISVMVPLFRESAIAERLLKRLAVLDYPRDRLDICLVVEEDDFQTRDTIARTVLPAWMREIRVPRGSLKTKPRALNYALDFCKGSIIGIYDAEDAPAPDQLLEVARRFSRCPPEVACLQGILDFYNSRTNWMARCFTVEYAAWFRVILPGLSRIGFALPLGGTTLFIRRAALEALDRWDAHNVTEDADLGIRLARHGFRTEMLTTVTEEEANCRLWPWVRQRSRWIKGHAVTYGVHMRAPGRLLADMGPRQFIGFQLMFLGALSQVLLAPVLWSFWALPLGLWHPLADIVPDRSLKLLTALFLGAEAVTVTVGMMATSGPTHRHLWPWVPSLHFYFPLATIAALKGFFEIVTRPFYWDKTSHGLHLPTGEAPEAPDIVTTAGRAFPHPV